VGLEVLQTLSALMSRHGLDDRKNLELIYEVGVKLARSHSIQAVADAAVELLFKIDHVHRAAVILWNHERGGFGDLGLKTRNGLGAGPLRSSYDPASVVMSRTILNRVRQQNVPLLIRDAKADAMLDSESSIIRRGYRPRCVLPSVFRSNSSGYYTRIIWPCPTLFPKVALERAPFVTSYDRRAAHKIGAELKPGLEQLDEPTARLVALREGLGIVVAGKSRRRRRLLPFREGDQHREGRQLDRKDRNCFQRARPARRSGKAVREDTWSAWRRAFQLAGSVGGDFHFRLAAGGAVVCASPGPAVERQMGRIDRGVTEVGGDRSCDAGQQGTPRGSGEVYQLALSHISTMSEREKYRTRGRLFPADTRLSKGGRAGQ
jgi:hypothetical protein